MVRAARFALSLALALVAYLLGVRLIPGFARVIDPFVVVLVLHALDGNALAGLLAGVVTGFLQDTVTGGLYGLHGVADTIVGYATARVVQRVVIQRASGAMLVFLSAAAVQQGTLVGLAMLFQGAPELPAALWVLVRIGSSGLLGLLLYLAVSQGSRRLEGWRRSRTSRLHFGRSR